MTELATFAGVEWSECEGFCNSNNNYEFISAFCLRSRGWRGILRKAPPMRVSAFPRPPQFFIPRLTDTDSAAGSHRWDRLRVAGRLKRPHGIQWIGEIELPLLADVTLTGDTVLP